MQYKTDFATHNNLYTKPRSGIRQQPFQDISRTARDILEYLYRLTDKGNKFAMASQVTLAEEFCCSRRTIIRCLRDLQDKGYIFPTQRSLSMVVHWAVSLTPRYLGQTLRTLPMVKYAHQSLKDFLNSIRKATVKKCQKMSHPCDKNVTHTRGTLVLTKGHHPPLEEGVVNPSDFKGIHFEEGGVPLRGPPQTPRKGDDVSSPINQPEPSVVNPDPKTQLARNDVISTLSQPAPIVVHQDPKEELFMLMIEYTDKYNLRTLSDRMTYWIYADIRRGIDRLKRALAANQRLEDV